MQKRLIIVDGWLLTEAGYGMASHAARLVHALAGSRLASRLMIAVPAGAEHFVPEGLSAFTLPDPFGVSPIVREAVWQNRLGGHVRRYYPEAVFLALSPFYSWHWPNRSVVVWHDLIPFQLKRYMGRFFYRRLLFKARLRRVHKTSFVVTDSCCTASALTRYQAFKPPMETIHLWTPSELADERSSQSLEAVRMKYGLPPRYWLYVGGYDYRKNVEYLIEAYGAVLAVHKCPPLVLAGKIPTNLRKPVCDVHGAMAKIGLTVGQVCLPGFIDPADMAALYRSAELFIYPSLAEGFGLPPLEAMACGCPAIVADATSLPEVVVDVGYRFSPHLSESLAALLSRAAQAPLPLNPGYDREYFSEKRGLGQYCDILERVAS